MVRNKMLSYGLVGIQFASIGLLLVSTPFNNLLRPFELLLIFSGLLLGFWAVWTMRVSKLQVYPDVATNATLVKTGPYKYIRHPMYAGVLLFSLGLFLLDMSFLRTIMYLLLCWDLFMKYRYEERLLLERFPEYAEYKLKTFRIIPFVY